MASELIIPRSATPGTPEYARTAISVAVSQARLLRQHTIAFVDRCHELQMEKVWEVYFEDGEKSWARLCREVLGVDPEYVTRLEEAVSRLNPPPWVGERQDEMPSPDELRDMLNEYLRHDLRPDHVLGRNREPGEEG